MTVIDRFNEIKQRMAKAAREAGRPDDTELVAVTKTFPVDEIVPVLEAGHRVFGENRVQEAQGRWASRRADLTDRELRLIGPLQTNKAADALALFDVIESVDREKLARALAEAGRKAGVQPRVLIQVNTGAEPQKAGVHPRDADVLIAAARAFGLGVEGLMCIPPAEEAAGPHFALLARIAHRNHLPVLSMGMSGDFETAVRFGATHVRVGSALFGERNPPLAPSKDASAP